MHFADAALDLIKAFAPRSSLYNQLHAQLARDAADDSNKTLVVCGLGEASKTELVLNYVRQHRAQ